MVKSARWRDNQGKITPNASWGLIMSRLLGMILAAAIWLSGCGLPFPSIQSTPELTRTPGRYIIHPQTPKPTSTSTPDPDDEYEMGLAEWLAAGELPSHLVLGEPSSAPDVDPPSDVHAFIPIQLLEDRTTAGSAQVIWYPDEVEAEKYIDNVAGENPQTFGEGALDGQEGVFVDKDDDDISMLEFSRSVIDENEFSLSVTELWRSEDGGAWVVRIELTNKKQHISHTALYEWSIEFIRSLSSGGSTED